MTCNVQTRISLHLPGSSTFVCNSRRVSSFLPRSRTTFSLSPQHHFHGFHVARNTMFDSQSQPPLLSADRKRDFSAYAASLELPLLPFGVNDVNHSFSTFSSIFISPVLCYISFAPIRNPRRRNENQRDKHTDYISSFPPIRDAIYPSCCFTLFNWNDGPIE